MNFSTVLRIINSSEGVEKISFENTRFFFRLRDTSNEVIRSIEGFCKGKVSIDIGKENLPKGHYCIEFFEIGDGIIKYPEDFDTYLFFVGEPFGNEESIEKTGFPNENAKIPDGNILIAGEGILWIGKDVSRIFREELEDLFYIIAYEYSIYRKNKIKFNMIEVLEKYGINWKRIAKRLKEEIPFNFDLLKFLKKVSKERKVTIYTDSPAFTLIKDFFKKFNLNLICSLEVFGVSKKEFREAFKMDGYKIFIGHDEREIMNAKLTGLFTISVDKRIGHLNVRHPMFIKKVFE